MITHTRTVMRECYKATRQVNGETGNSTSCHAKTP